MQPNEEYRKEAASPSSTSAAIGEGLSRDGVAENCFRYKIIYRASGNTRADLGSFAELLELRRKAPLPIGADITNGARDFWSLQKNKREGEQRYNA